MKLMWHTLPIIGTLAAMIGGAAFFTLNSLWLTLGVTIFLTLAGAALYLLGGVGLPRPDLVAWIERNRPAIGSPPLVQSLRES